MSGCTNDINNNNNNNERNIMLINKDTGNSLLHDAIHEKKTLDDIMKIIEQQPNIVQHKNKSEQYPLHLACCFRYNDEYNPVFVTLLELYPKAVEEKDINGNYPLHLALKNRQSAYVIKLLLSAYPLAVQLMNEEKQYPLNIACKYIPCENNFSGELIILTLIDMYPHAAEHNDCMQCYPLHDICNHYKFSAKVAIRLLDVCPNAAKYIGKFGNTPLHLACENCSKHSEKLLHRLINIFPQAIETPNEANKYPLHCALYNSHNISMMVLLKVSPFLGLPSRYHLWNSCRCTPLWKLFSFFKFVRELPRCKFHMEQEWKKILFLVLHLLDAYPNQAMCKCRAYCYPLHYACQQGVDDKIILCLMNTNLLAVMETCEQGKYPLDYAKDSNLTNISYVLEDLMKKDYDELKKRVGIPSIVTSHDITNVFRSSIMEWVQCNTPSYIQGKYTQTVPETKRTASCPTFYNANCGTRKIARDNECRECTELEKSAIFKIPIIDMYYNVP